MCNLYMSMVAPSRIEWFCISKWTIHDATSEASMAIKRFIFQQLKRLIKHSPRDSLRRIATTAAMLSLPMVVFAAPSTQIFRAQLMPLNVSVGGGAEGTVTLTINDDTLTINANVTGLSPAMHMIHIHGFTVGDKAATCASVGEDKDGDGIIDVIETELVSGVTLIPFDDQPAALVIPSGTYPHANASGAFHYRAAVSLADLNAALERQFGIDGVHLDKRVIYVHGVADRYPLPATVHSLPGVPAIVTLPVACGVIRAAP